MPEKMLFYMWLKGILALVVTHIIIEFVINEIAEVEY